MASSPSVNEAAALAPETRAAIGARARQAVADEYSKEALCTAFCDIVERSMREPKDETISWGAWGRADHRCAAVPSSPQCVTDLGARPGLDPRHPEKDEPPPDSRRSSLAARR